MCIIQFIYFQKMKTIVVICLCIEKKEVLFGTSFNLIFFS